MAILFRPFDCPAPKDFKVMWLSNILTLTVLDEDYFRNVCLSCTLNLIFTYLLLSLGRYLCVYTISPLGIIQSVVSVSSLIIILLIYTGISGITAYIKVYVWTFALCIYYIYKVYWYPASYVEQCTHKNPEKSNNGQPQTAL